MLSIARRAYGYHSAEYLLSMLFLRAGGIELNTPLRIEAPGKALFRYAIGPSG